MRESGLHAERTVMYMTVRLGKAGRAGARRRGNRHNVVPLEKSNGKKAARGVACKVEIADRKTAIGNPHLSMRAPAAGAGCCRHERAKAIQVRSMLTAGPGASRGRGL